MTLESTPGAPVVIILDYGIGNLGSIANMIRRIGGEVTVSGDPRVVATADRIILPGVGAFDTGMKALLQSGLVEPLRRRVVDEGAPLLGICLGMQLLTAGSEEGRLPGLHWVPAETVAFRLPPEEPELRVPHMGWNSVTIRRRDSLFRHCAGESRFYFVHSYHVRCRSEDDVLATCSYGLELTAAFQHGNVYGVQFHPEKSHRFGMDVLRAFCELETSGPAQPP